MSAAAQQTQDQIDFAKIEKQIDDSMRKSDQPVDLARGKKKGSGVSWWLVTAVVAVFLIGSYFVSAKLAVTSNKASEMEMRIVSKLDQTATAIDHVLANEKVIDKRITQTNRQVTQNSIKTHNLEKRTEGIERQLKSFMTEQRAAQKALAATIAANAKTATAAPAAEQTTASAEAPSTVSSDDSAPKPTVLGEADGCKIESDGFVHCRRK